MKEFLLGTAQYLSGVEVDWSVYFFSFQNGRWITLSILAAAVLTTCADFHFVFTTRRIGFVFDLYDTDRSGLLCRKELIEVLKANHMQVNFLIRNVWQREILLRQHARRLWVLREIRSIHHRIPKLC